MKVLFTADIHIKLGQKNVPVEWAKNRYKLLFSDLAALSHQCDLTILGGDIFDRVPTVEELEVYFELVSHINSECIIYSGNHEALKRDTTFLSYLSKVTSKVNNKVRIIDDFYTYKDIDFIPYNKLKEYHPADIDFHSRTLCTHVRGEIPPHVKAEVNLDIFNRWDIVLAGDLHSYDNCQRNILYPGSPITTSFHRNTVSTGVILYDTETLAHDWIELELPQLIRKTIRAGEEAVATSYHHTIYDVEGDMAELSELADNDLVDKKVSKRDTDVALILDTGMSIQEEVTEYLTYILQLSGDSLTNALKELSNHTEALNSLQSS